jgi:hypothetical protein
MPAIGEGMRWRALHNPENRFSYTVVSAPRVTQRRGDHIGQNRVAREDAPAGVTTCPACQHRSCTFMRSKETADSITSA